MKEWIVVVGMLVNLLGSLMGLYLLNRNVDMRLLALESKVSKMEDRFYDLMKVAINRSVNPNQ